MGLRELGNRGQLGDTPRRSSLFTREVYTFKQHVPVSSAWLTNDRSRVCCRQTGNYRGAAFFPQQMNGWHTFAKLHSLTRSPEESPHHPCTSSNPHV